MTGGGNDRYVFECSQARSRLHNLWEEGERNAERVQQPAGPGACKGVEHLGGGGVAEFANLGPAQPEVEQIGNGQEALCDLQMGGVAFHQAHHLVERIDGHELDAGLGEHLFFGDARKDFLQHPLGAAVAVADRVADEIVVAVEEAEVYAPGINGQAGGAGARPRFAAVDAGLHFAPEV